MENQTRIVYFILLGLSSDWHIQMVLFWVFFVIYTVTLGGNIVVIMVIWGSHHLHSPMYFLLSHLSFLDICLSSVTVPKLLLNFSERQTISYGNCIAQMFFIFLTTCTEIFVLTAMSYDRYAAICKPLHYVQIMSKTFCRWLVGGSWLVGFLYAMTNTLPILNLVFCGRNIISHFSCEFTSLLALSCTETSLNNFIFFTTAGTIGGSTFLIILISYAHIAINILKIHSAEAKRKMFSTCSSHLIVLVLYYSTGCVRFMRPDTASSIIVDELLSIQYGISTPMLNPIIYSLKTREIKEGIKKLMGYKQQPIAHAV